MSKRSSLTVPLMALLVMATLVTLCAAMPPQPGAGGPDGSCRSCHVGESGTTIGASLAIEGVPAMYEPGHAYNLRVVLDRGEGPPLQQALLHAFQLAASAGELAVVDAATMDIGTLEVGSRGASNATEWRVVWTAPHSRADVWFWATAVVADGDGTEEGDVTVEAQVRSFGQLDVPHENPPGPSPWTWVAVALAVVTLTIVGYVLAFTHRHPPPPEFDD